MCKNRYYIGITGIETDNSEKQVRVITGIKTEKQVNNQILWPKQVTHIILINRFKQILSFIGSVKTQRR